MASGREPIWMVRRPDPGFVGREGELAALEAALAASGRSALRQPAAVHGLGGVGKSLLAVEFAYRHADHYDAVFWLPAEEPTALASAVADLARKLGLPEAAEPDQAVRTAAVLAWLEGHDRWLLVFDNAERRADVEPYVPIRITGHVLITSRNPDWHPLARPVKVPTLPRPDSIALLRSGLGPGDEAAADRLAGVLGDLPLALAQAAAYVRETARSFTEYLDRFQHQQAAFDHDQGAEPGYGRTVAATLELALAVLREPGRDGLSPAETVLTRCAFYAPDRIPRELLAADSPDGKALDDAIRELRHYSLIETAAGAVSVHRLVQRAVQMRMSTAEREVYAGHAVEVIAKLFPDKPDEVRTWPECDKLLSHALHATEAAEHLGELASLVALVLDLVGVHLLAKADLRRARGQLLRALKLKEEVYGPDHPQVAITLGILGSVARRQGDLDEARRCHERALWLKEAAYGPDHPEVAITLGNLSSVARWQGDLDEARRFLERALPIEEAAYGPDHPQVAINLGNLGIVAVEQGHLDEARRCHERALRLKEAAYGPDHPEVARTLTNLGIVAQHQGNLDEARRCQERALPIEEAAYGPDHPEVARTLTSLGDVAREQGDLAEARWLYERALRTFRKFLGHEHPTTIRNINKLRSLDENPSESAHGPENSPGGTMIKVFISYSHDSNEHADRVLALADALCGLGIDVTLDRYVHPAPEEGWPRWMDRNLDEARFVLMICTETYRRRVMGREEPGKGLGVSWEGSLIYNRIYHDKPSGSRFIPVLLPGSEPAHIPNPVQGHSYYRIVTFDLTHPGFEALYRHLTNQPATTRPGLGAITVLPPRPRPQPSADPLPPSGGPMTNVSDKAVSPAANDLDDHIRDLLRPLMGTQHNRQARLSRVFAAYPGLLDRIDTHGETGIFLSHLIQTLRDYGEVEPGRPSVAVLLGSLRDEVGAGDRQRIDQILRTVSGS